MRQLTVDRRVIHGNPRLCLLAVMYPLDKNVKTVLAAISQSGAAKQRLARDRVRHRPDVCIFIALIARRDLVKLDLSYSNRSN